MVETQYYHERRRPFFGVVGGMLLSFDSAKSFCYLLNVSEEVCLQFSVEFIMYQNPILVVLPKMS